MLCYQGGEWLLVSRQAEFNTCSSRTHSIIKHNTHGLTESPWAL